jgi:hypothetical protein
MGYVHAIVLLGAPLALFGVFALCGFGLAVVLGPKFAPDAQAALAPLLGVAVLATASVLLSVGVPAVPLGLVVLILPSLLTIALRKRVYPALRACGRPFAIGLVAVFLAGAPNLAGGNWTVKTYLGHTTDAYFWISQARSLYDAPPKAPSSRYPDRLAYERIQEQHWALALSFATGEAAWISQSDPADVYGLIAAFVACLTPLAAYFCARACLDWRPRRATFLALALAANASLLFAGYFSWQQQLIGTGLAFAALAVLRLALEPPRSLRLQFLAAFLASAALASYRMAFAPYFAAMIAVVIASYLISHSGVDRRQALRSVLGFSAIFAGLAAVSLFALVRGLNTFLALGVNTSFKKIFPGGYVPEALGLFPRLFGAGSSWGLVAAAASVPFFIIPLARLRRSSAKRVDFVFGSALFIVGAYAFLLATKASTPYTSFKLLAYGTPFLLLVVFGAEWLSKPTRARTAGVVVLALLFSTSTLLAVGVGAKDSESARDFSGLAAVAPKLGHDVVSVQVVDPWDQAWATYYLRDVPLSVETPSLVLVGVAMFRPASIYHHPGAAYVLREGSAGSIWQGSGLALDRRETPAPEVATPARDPLETSLPTLAANR